MVGGQTPLINAVGPLAFDAVNGLQKETKPVLSQPSDGLLRTHNIYLLWTACCRYIGPIASRNEDSLAYKCSDRADRRTGSRERALLLIISVDPVHEICIKFRPTGITAPIGIMGISSGFLLAVVTFDQ